MRAWVLLLCVLVTVVAGVAYWKQRSVKVAAQLAARKSFQFMDQDRKFFSTADLRPGQKILALFTPDFLHQADVKPFSELSRGLGGLEGRGIEVAVVTRLPMDQARDFARAARYTKRLLADPSGSFGRWIGVIDGHQLTRRWGVALLERNLKVDWAVVLDQVPTTEQVERALAR
ncbi:MAG: hypothetical protein HUU37_00250 [Bdellovibrionales bacterium]|nr:hypothetical protein [Bdellovibrionales bacterium]